MLSIVSLQPWAATKAWCSNPFKVSREREMVKFVVVEARVWSVEERVAGSEVGWRSMDCVGFFLLRSPSDRREEIRLMVDGLLGLGSLAGIEQCWSSVF